MHFYGLSKSCQLSRTDDLRKTHSVKVWQRRSKLTAHGSLLYHDALYS